jgi:hypothetical protein
MSARVCFVEKPSMANRFRATRILLYSAVVLAVIGASYFHWRSGRPELVSLPGVDEIERMTAELYDTTDSFGIQALPEFAIPQEDRGLILSALTPAQRERTLASTKDVALGRISIVTKNGETKNVVFFAFGKNVLIFSVNGLSCMRGGEFRPYIIRGDYEGYLDESINLCFMLRGIHDKMVSGIESEPLKTSVSWLRRSKGEIPPEQR